VIMFLLWSSCVFAAEQVRNHQPVQYRIFTLKHISAEQGRKYLAQVNIGTVSQLPGAGVLLVTAQPSELTKAATILKLVDAEEEFAIKAISPVSEVENLPSNEQIAAMVGGISIGTFFSPPENQKGARAIIDVHNDSVVAIAPAGLLEKIVSAIGQPGEKGVEKPRPVGVEPAGPSEPSATTPVSRQVGAETWVQSYEPEPLPNGDEILNLTLPEKLDLVSLLGLVGEYLHLDYMYDPAQVKAGGEVTLKLQGKLRGAMRVKDLYPLLESVMKFRGFVMTRKGNLVTVVPAGQILDIDPTLATDKRRIEHGDVVITRAFQLKHIDTASAINLLNSMKLGTTVSPIPDTGMLIVTEYAYRMARIEELLEMVDKPGAPRQFRFRQLRYTMAKTLAPKIKTLAEQLGTVSITVAATQAPTPVPPGRPVPRPVTPTPAAGQPAVYLDADERTNRILMIGLEGQLNVVDGLIDALDTEQQDLRTMKVYKIEHVGADEVKKKLQELGIIGGTAETPSRITGPARALEAAGQPPTPGAPRTAAVTTGTVTEALVEQPQVVVLEPTNSLLINATAEQHAQIAGIISYVDSETEKGTIPYVIYPLENQKPEDMDEVLNKLIKETVKDKEGKIQQVVKKTEEEIIFVPDKNTCSIIVYASKKNQEWIANLIKTLDKRRPQVLIDVTLVEISKGDKFDYDLKLLSSLPDLTNTSGMTRGLMGDANSTNLVARLINSGRDRFIDFQATNATGVETGTGFYADRHVNALLTAMQTKDYGRVLAKPKILVNDNEKGTIKTTDTTYVTKRSSTPIYSTATTPTGQQQSWDTAVSYEPYDTGITLDITPHISEGKLLRLEISLTRSDFQDRASAAAQNRPPDKTASDITTVVTVPDGSTIILGGMLKLDQGKGGTKVPLLGDIPLVGGLFRSVSTRDSQRKLYLFVKAEIIRPAQSAVAGLPDLERISERNRLAFEKHEAEFQNYQDWPGIKPKPVEPFKVLEAQ
jgi:type II secretory pathway component GspD/PulD (secretin)